MHAWRIMILTWPGNLSTTVYHSLHVRAGCLPALCLHLAYWLYMDGCCFVASPQLIGYFRAVHGRKLCPVLFVSFLSDVVDLGPASDLVPILRGCAVCVPICVLGGYFLGALGT